jgi:hypothetical protein
MQQPFHLKKDLTSPMNPVYESTAYFRFLDYHISHGQLLIRGEKALEGDNIDIIFEGTAFLNCPTRFDGIKIYYLDDDYSKERCISIFPFIRNFLIVSKNVEYLVQAAVLRIYRNSLDVFETSIDMTGKGQENLIWISKF